MLDIRRRARETDDSNLSDILHKALLLSKSNEELLASNKKYARERRLSNPDRVGSPQSSFDATPKMNSSSRRGVDHAVDDSSSVTPSLVSDSYKGTPRPYEVVNTRALSAAEIVPEERVARYRDPSPLSQAESMPSTTTTPFHQEREAVRHAHVSRSPVDRPRRSQLSEDLLIYSSVALGTACCVLLFLRFSKR